MEKNKSLIKYTGQILVILLLELIILLFRIAVPVGSNIPGISEVYVDIIGEFTYFVIQLFLIIVVVNHYVFKKSYSSMGIVNVKQNLFSMVGNLLYLAIIGVSTILIIKVAGETYLYTAVQAVISVILVFVSKAFIQEVIYRGCIMKSFNSIFKNAILSVVCSSLLFATVHLALGIIGSGFDTNYISGLSFKFIGSLLIGTYLGTIYYLTNNIWICIIIHGTYEAIPIVGYQFLIPVFQVMYIAGAIVYLIYEVVASKKLNQEECEEDEEDNIEKLEVEGIEQSDKFEVKEYADDKLVDVDLNIEMTKDMGLLKLDNIDDLTKTTIIKTNLEEYKEDRVDHTTDTKQYIPPKSKEEIDFNKTSIIRIEDIEKAVKESKGIGYINHLKSSLGKVIGNYKNIISTDLSIYVLAFEGEKFNALVTDGIRFKSMNVPEYLEGSAYSEIVVFVSKEFDISEQGITKKESAWIVDALDDTIRQLQTGDKYLGWGHVFKNQDNMKPYNDEMGLCGVFIYPPVVQEDMTFYTFKEDSKTTYIYSAMPIYKEELECILETSGDVYFSKLKESNVSQVVCKNRINICKDTSLV